MSNAKNLPYFRRHSLGEIRDPVLGRALSAWREISGRDGCFDASGGLHRLFGNGNIMLPSASYVIVEGDDPANFLFGWFGQGFGAFGNRNFTGYRIKDMPEKNFVASVTEIFGRAVEEREPAYHHVIAELDGEVFDYHRLLFPVVDQGKVDAFVTVSVSERYAYLRQRNTH